jgi:predicted neuraminidase
MKVLRLVLLLLSTPAVAQYRIVEDHLLSTAPATPAAHASTLVEVSEGRLLAAWFGGQEEGHASVGIYLAKYDGKEWSEGTQVAAPETLEGVTYPCWNPVLVKNRANKLFLYYKVGPNPREWWGQVITSLDEGKTWSAPERLPEGFLGPVRVKPVMLANGDFLYPSSTETPDTDYWSAHFEVSDNEGKNWQMIPMDCDTFQIIQPTVLEFSEGKILMLARSRHNKVVAAYSHNYGNHWAKPFALNLPNPNAGIDAVKVNKNLFLMVYNPLLAGKNWWEGRSKLVLGSSADGLTWKEILTLEEHEKGEYSYPAIIKTKDGKIHITYTFDRQQIKHLVLTNSKSSGK